MASYARKPQTIEAHQWNSDVTEKMPAWLYDAIMEGDKFVMKGRGLFMRTGEEVEGDVFVDDGTYIIKEGDGDISTRNRCVFESEWYLLK